MLEGNCVEHRNRNTDPRLKGYLKGQILLSFGNLELYVILETVYIEILAGNDFGLHVVCKFIRKFSECDAAGISNNK